MTEIWTKIIVLSIGGVLGVNARYWQGAWINRVTSPQFPWATVIINVTGSFLIGFLAVVLTRWMPHPNVRLMVITGILGGYTTFSTFENDALTLWERGEGMLMAANLIGSVAAGFGAVVLGTALARGLTESAGERAATGFRTVASSTGDPFHPVRAKDDRPVAAEIDAVGGDDGHRGEKEGSPQ